MQTEMHVRGCHAWGRAGSMRQRPRCGAAWMRSATISAASACFVVSRVLTDWQAALLYVRTYPYAAHVMVSLLTVPQCNRCSISGWVAAAQHCKAVLQFAEAMQKRFSYASLRECGVSRPQ